MNSWLPQSIIPGAEMRIELQCTRHCRWIALFATIDKRAISKNPVRNRVNSRKVSAGSYRDLRIYANDTKLFHLTSRSRDEISFR